MRHVFGWVAPVVVIALGAASGCSLSQQRQGPLDAISGRDSGAAVQSPAQLASQQPGTVQTPQGGYQANLVSASRSAPAAKRFQIPKCASSG